MENENAGVDEVLGSEDTGVEEDGTVSSAEPEDTTDWKAIAEAEKERAENYKTALTQKRQLRNKPTPPETEEDDDRPLTKKDIRALLQEEVVPLVASSKEDTLLSQKISDPAKRAYVKQLLSNRIVRTGTSDTDIQNDIDEAIWLADRKKTTKTLSELKRAADNKPPVPSAGSSNEITVEQKPYKWTAEQSAALEKKAKLIGLDPEKFKQQAWENQKKTKVI